jgi:hypothetical protein
MVKQTAIDNIMKGTHGRFLLPSKEDLMQFNKHTMFPNRLH